MGMASFLANSGSGGAAEYIPGDVIAAGYVSTREPKQMFEEMLALVTRSDPSVLSRLAQVEVGAGHQFLQRSRRFRRARNRLSALESLSTSGPVWMMAALVNNPGDARHTPFAGWWKRGMRKGEREGRTAAHHNRTGNRGWADVDVDEILLGSAGNRLDL